MDEYIVRRVLHQPGAIRQTVKRANGVKAGAVCILLSDYTVFRKKQILRGSKPFTNIGEVTIARETGDRPGGASLTANPPHYLKKKEKKATSSPPCKKQRTPSA